MTVRPASPRREASLLDLPDRLTPVRFFFFVPPPQAPNASGGA